MSQDWLSLPIGVGGNSRCPPTGMSVISSSSASPSPNAAPGPRSYGAQSRADMMKLSDFGLALVRLFMGSKPSDMANIASAVTTTP